MIDKYVTIYMYTLTIVNLSLIHCDSNQFNMLR